MISDVPPFTSPVSKSAGQNMSDVKKITKASLTLRKVKYKENFHLTWKQSTLHGMSVRIKTGSAKKKFMVLAESIGPCLFLF
jgi:hypothetical protein